MFSIWSVLLLNTIIIMNFIVFSSIFAEQPSSNNRNKKRQIQLNISPDKLNLFLHQTAIIGLLKAKSEHCLHGMPFTERIVFRECANDKNGHQKTPKELAKCLSRLLKMRYRMAQWMDNKMGSNGGDGIGRDWQLLDRKEEADLFSRMMKMLFWVYENVTGRRPGSANLNNDGIEEGHKNGQIGNKISRWKREGRKSNFGRMRERQLWRTKRHIGHEVVEQKGEEHLRHIKKFKRIKYYYELAEYCSGHLSRLDRLNSEFFKTQQQPLELHSEPIGQLNGILTDIEALLGNLHFQKFSILSPQIVPLFGRHNAKGTRSNNKNSSLPSQLSSILSLSPSVFSFSRDGFLSLPDIFDKLSLGHAEELEWLDLILSLTDAGKKLDKMMVDLEPKIADLETRVLPAVEAMEMEERNWQRLKKSLSGRQQQELAEKGYTFLGKRQRRLAYARARANANPSEAMAFTQMATNEAEFEEQIHRLAEIEDKDLIGGGRQRRQIVDPLPPNEGPTMQSNQFLILQPYAFSNQFNNGVIVQGLILSPYFWQTELLSPDTLTTEILSPNAFGASILSANILISRILSPTAFNLQLLSPEIGAIYILNPEALFAEILTPNILAPRIGSAEYLSVSILAPNILQPRIMAVDVAGINVLSPNILSPRYNSSEKFMLEILSPHILGGEHESSDEEIENEEEDKEAGHEVHEGQQHGGNKDASHREVAPGITELGGGVGSGDEGHNHNNDRQMKSHGEMERHKNGENNGLPNGGGGIFRRAFKL